ncbi:MAG: hypothetical protein IPM55_17820 [Acidobacteria bacterium]|nr:hypothetical protein [Acidobacteriota bacterium]
MVYHATFDLDILIEASRENVNNLLAALIEATLGSAALITTEELLANEITIFKDRVRIDVQTSTPGLQFEDAWNNRIRMSYQGQEFYVVSKSDLIASKLSAGRQIDLEDVKMLTVDQER